MYKTYLVIPLHLHTVHFPVQPVTRIKAEVFVVEEVALEGLLKSTGVNHSHTFVIPVKCVVPGISHQIVVTQIMDLETVPIQHTHWDVIVRK